MTFIGFRVLKIYPLIMNEKDLQPLKNLWLPAIAGVAILYILIWNDIIIDFFGLIQDSTYLSLLDVLWIVASMIESLGMYRFTKTISDFEKKKKVSKDASAQSIKEIYDQRRA